MGGKKKEDDSPDPVYDNESEIDNRPAGTDAEVFSQPMGFIPRFPPPPKYIKVKAQNRKQKDFDRVFLSQVLLGERPSKSRTPSDAKIVSIETSIDDASPAPSRGSANKAIWAMKFSEDGKYLAAAGQDLKLRVWEVFGTHEDRELEEREINGGSDDGQNVKLNAPVFKKKPFRTYDGHTSSILDVCWSKNNFLLSSSMDKTVRLYHITRSACLFSFVHADFVTSIQFHPKDDRFFLAGSLDSKLRLWSIPDKTVAYSAQTTSMITAVSFSPDGKTALAGCLNGLCVLYDTEGLKAHSQLHVRSARGRNSRGSKITGIKTINMPRPDGHHDIKVLITSNDSRVRMYDLKTRNLEIKFRGNENNCSQIHATFSDDGKWIICGSEDGKVYLWPTGPAEKQDPEKRPVEIFEVGSAIVTTALLAPTKTRQLLASSGDPLFDLCNPPPVTLLSRSDSAISSRAPTDITGHSGKEQDPTNGAPWKSDSPRRAPETPAYLARQEHKGGNIIVTADYTGSIKIFRQDCAYLKRRHESWEGSSAFSKKMLGRSGSVNTTNTKTSVGSSINANRNSTSLGSKQPSTDRIINWRNSITSTGTNGNGNRNSVSETNLKGTLNAEERARSASPKKSLSQRFSLRKSPPPSPKGTSPQHGEPHITLQPSSPLTAEPDSMVPSSPSAQSPGSPHYNPVPHDPDDPLYLQGSQSFMYWNVKNNVASMLNPPPPRTPGLLPPNGGRNPLSRAQSVVSQLSSEVRSSGSSRIEEFEDADQGMVQPCNRCGNTKFKEVTGERAGQNKMACTRCGLVL